MNHQRKIRIEIDGVENPPKLFVNGEQYIVQSIEHKYLTDDVDGGEHRLSIIYVDKDNHVRRTIDVGYRSSHETLLDVDKESSY